MADSASPASPDGPEPNDDLDWLSDRMAVFEAVSEKFLEFRDNVRLGSDGWFVIRLYNEAVIAGGKTDNFVNDADLVLPAEDQRAIDKAFVLYDMMHQVFDGNADELYFHAGAQLIEIATGVLLEVPLEQDLQRMEDELAQLLEAGAFEADQQTRWAKAWSNLTGQNPAELQRQLDRLNKQTEKMLKRDEKTWRRLLRSISHEMMAPMWELRSPKLGRTDFGLAAAGDRLSELVELAADGADLASELALDAWDVAVEATLDAYDSLQEAIADAFDAAEGSFERVGDIVSEASAHVVSTFALARTEIDAWSVPGGNLNGLQGAGADALFYVGDRIRDVGDTIVDVVDENRRAILTGLGIGALAGLGLLAYNKRDGISAAIDKGRQGTAPAITQSQQPAAPTQSPTPATPTVPPAATVPVPQEADGQRFIDANGGANFMQTLQAENPGMSNGQAAAFEDALAHGDYQMAVDLIAERGSNGMRAHGKSTPTSFRLIEFVSAQRVLQTVRTREPVAETAKALNLLAWAQRADPATEVSAAVRQAQRATAAGRPVDQWATDGLMNEVATIIDPAATQVATNGVLPTP